jgi:hypothetical protein
MENIINIEQKKDNEYLLFYSKGKINKLIFDTQNFSFNDTDNKMELFKNLEIDSSYKKAYQIGNKNLIFEKPDNLKILNNLE